MKIIKCIFIGVVLVFILPQCKKDLNNTGYAIGVINLYNMGGKGHFSEINYTFYVKGIEYDNHYKNRAWGKKWKVPPTGNYQKGDKFMVQYDSLDPGRKRYSSRMLFDYPVKDSSDYRRYMDEFTTNPPD